jgi:RHS repeat-associated protein
MFYHVTAYVYDALGRVTTVTNPDSSQRGIFYELAAWETTDESGIQKIYQADGMGRLASVCDGIGAGQQADNSQAQPCNLGIPGSGFLTSYTYNLLGEITSVSTVSTVSQQQRYYSYDGLGRLLSEMNPETGSAYTYYGYDTQSKGDLYNRIRPAANGASGTTTTTYTHDVLHRLTNVSYNDNITPSVTLVYDVAPSWWTGPPTPSNLLGRLTNATSAGGSAGTAFSYDPMGHDSYEFQCSPLNCGNGSTGVGYTYNHLGQLSSYSDTEVNATYTYNYDTNARLSSITSSLNNPTTLFSVPTGGYNAFGEITSATLGNGVSRAITYDLRGRILTLTDGPSTNPIYAYSLSYSNGSVTGNNIITANDNTGNWTYAYDPFGRIYTSCSSSGQSCTGSNVVQSYTYGYDPYGNRWHQDLTAGTGESSIDYSFNASNQITGSGITFDAEGNELTDGLGNTYSYDAENRAVQVTGSNSVTYTYDAFGRRVEQTIGAPPNGTRYDYVYGPGGVADMWSATFGLGWAQLAGTTSLGVYGTGGTFFYHPNWLGTLRAISNISGNLSTACTSLPFGDAMSCSAHITPIPGDIEYTGQEWDSSVNLTHFPMRSYSMTQGRWMHADPAGLSSVDPTTPHSWNRYAYVVNNPVTYVDPMGLVLYVDGPGINAPETGEPPSPVLAPPSPIIPPPIGIGGGGHGNPCVYVLKKPCDITKAWNKTFPCNQNASQVMSAVQNDMGQFADNQSPFFGAIFPDEPISLGGQYSIQAGVMNNTANMIGSTAGGLIPISNLTVTTTAESPTSWTFTTDPSQHYFDGTVTFSADDVGGGNVAFSIDAEANYSNAFYAFFGSVIGLGEDSTWNNMLNNVQSYCQSGSH